MKTEIEIRGKIEELEKGLQIIETAKDAELAKKIRSRDVNMLNFLFKEYNRYRLAIAQLRWTLHSSVNEQD
jgi:hypothetical protein